MVAIRLGRNHNGNVIHNLAGNSSMAVRIGCKSPQQQGPRKLHANNMARKMGAPWRQCGASFASAEQDGVMKLGHACTFPNEPRGETPAPPAENRAPALPCPLPRRALSSQIAGRVCHAVLAVLRAMDAASVLRLAGTLLAQALHAWRPGQACATVPRHTRRPAGAGVPRLQLPDSASS